MMREVSHVWGSNSKLYQNMLLDLNAAVILASIYIILLSKLFILSWSLYR